MKRNTPEVIDVSDDESRRRKSSVKKRAEPVPSKEVLELQQKLATSEKDNMDAIRIAGEAQARVKYLENLIDKERESIRDGGDGEEKKQVAELQKKIGELTNNRDQLERKLKWADEREKKLVEELQEKIDDLPNNRDELERKLKWANEREKKLAEEQQKRIEELTKENVMARLKVAVTDDSEKELQKKVSSLTKQLEMERSTANVDRERDRVRIDELARLADEGANQTNNIFELLPTNAPDTVPYDLVVRALRACEKHLKYFHGKRVWPERREELFKDESLYCALCKKGFEKEKILDHFYSQEHAKKVRARTSAVTCGSVKHWFDKVRRSMDQAEYKQILQQVDAAIDNGEAFSDENEE